MSDASPNDSKIVEEKSSDTKDESKGEDEELDALLDGNWSISHLYLIRGSIEVFCYTKG